MLRWENSLIDITRLILALRLLWWHSTVMIKNFCWWTRSIGINGGWGRVNDDGHVRKGKGKFCPRLLFPPGGLFVTCCHFGELRNPHLCKLSLWNTQSYKLGQRPIGLVGVASWPHGLGHNKAVFIKSFDILKWVANAWNWSVLNVLPVRTVSSATV